MKLGDAVPGYRVNSRYGPRTPIKIPGGETLPYHYGDDQAAPAGTPIRASLAGVVTRSGEDNNPNYEAQGIVRWPGLKKGWLYGGGYWVFIQTGNIEVRYMHMNWWPPVKVGQKVAQGQVIGYVGNTGVSTGAHLHKEVLDNGRHVDPQSDFPQLDPVPQLPLGKGEEMFMIYLKDGGRKKGDHLFAVVGPNFWMEFVGQESANNLVSQITNSGRSLEVSKSFWDHCKKAALTGQASR